MESFIRSVLISQIVNWNNATRHRAVCDKFGGGENKSLRHYTALDELDQFREAHLKSIDPQLTGTTLFLKLGGRLFHVKK